MAVPSTSSRPWCQVAAAARGDGTVEVFDVDKASSSSNSSAVSSGAKPGKGRGAAAVQGDPGAATAGRNAIGSSSSSGGGIMGNRGSGGRPWHWPLVLNRAGGGHTRPATAVCFVGDAEACDRGDPAQGPVGTQEGASSSAPSQPKSNSGGSSGRPTKGVGSRTPTHLLSGSEDRRLLLWRLPRLGQGQAGGLEWQPTPESGSEQCREGGGASESCSGDGEERRHIVAEHAHGRKINCVYVSSLYQQMPQEDHLQHLTFVGDTSKRLQVYKLTV
eukprot:1148091-Pelagomonas_calceolata.AAC.10